MQHICTLPIFAPKHFCRVMPAPNPLFSPIFLWISGFVFLQEDFFNLASFTDDYAP
jgi:hypothetical protein